MIKCWIIGRRVARSAHRVVHRIRHHYHAPAIKIIAPAVVCVITGAGLAPWLAPLASVPGTIGPQPASYSAFDTPAPLPEITLPTDILNLPPELMTINIKYPITSLQPIPESVQPVPEPPTILLLGTAISVVLGLAMYRRFRAERAPNK